MRNVVCVKCVNQFCCCWWWCDRALSAGCWARWQLVYDVRASQLVLRRVQWYLRAVRLRWMCWKWQPLWDRVGLQGGVCWCRRLCRSRPRYVCTELQQKEWTDQLCKTFGFKIVLWQIHTCQSVRPSPRSRFWSHICNRISIYIRFDSYSSKESAACQWRFGIMVQMWQKTSSTSRLIEAEIEANCFYIYYVLV